MTLAEQQAAFQAAVRDGAELPPGLLRGRMAQRGLAVYRHAYGARLTEALRDNYAGLHQALGDADFDALAAAYLTAHPPTEPSIRWFGDRLPAFMDDWPTLPHPALADLARLDWALRAAFDGAEHPALTEHALRALPPAAWARLPLRLQPHLQLLRLQWEVAPAWHALTQARERGEEADLPAPQALPHSLAVARADDGRTHWQSLAEDEAQALATLADAPMLADWLAQRGEAELVASVALLQRWAQAHWLVAPDTVAYT